MLIIQLNVCIASASQTLQTRSHFAFSKRFILNNDPHFGLQIG